MNNLNILDLPENLAKKICYEQNMTCRVVSRDDQYFDTKTDWQVDRVNLTILNGKVVGYSIG